MTPQTYANRSKQLLTCLQNTFIRNLSWKRKTSSQRTFLLAKYLALKDLANEKHEKNAFPARFLPLIYRKQSNSFQLKINPRAPQGPQLTHPIQIQVQTHWQSCWHDKPIDKLVSLTTFISLSILLTWQPCWHTPPPLIFFYLKYSIQGNPAPIKNQPLKLFLDCLRLNLDRPRFNDIPKQTKWHHGYIQTVLRPLRPAPENPPT